MNLFNLQWFWYEEEMNFLFVHENKTEEEFKKDIESKIVEIGQQYLDENKDMFVGANGWIEYTSKHLQPLGYIPIHPSTWNFFGAYIINNEETESSDMKKWKSIVGESLFNKAVEHNIIIEKKMFE